jgi:hypothetical protein
MRVVFIATGNGAVPTGTVSSAAALAGWFVMVKGLVTRPIEGLFGAGIGDHDGLGIDHSGREKQMFVPHRRFLRAASMASIQ